ncbi:serine/threonine protein kinase, partial [bacterium]|nr:serine/threonine protein kinase [candidate division CSSED10-310 bacterium]
MIRGQVSSRFSPIALMTSTERVPLEWSPGTILFTYYNIEHLLGSGGTGTVYRVRRTYDDREFAVKTLHTATLHDITKRRMLMQELRTWIDLPDYPHLVRCRFFRTINKQLVIFSEYISGGSLDSWIREKKLTDIKAILDIVIQAAWGLQVAHGQGVIHQDVKPGNILLTYDGTAKITDFGIAKIRKTVAGLINDSQSKETHRISSQSLTPAYCSPEQAMGHKICR